MISGEAARLFARAEQAFAAGRLDAARADLVEAKRIGAVGANVPHLLALVEKRRGDLAASRAAFELALRLAPRDPGILNNFANLLDALGEREAALDCYDRALATDPLYADARYNRALLLDRLERHGDALAQLDRVLALAPSAKGHSARGGVLKRLGRPDEAAAAYDAALALEPQRVASLHGRARLALERGEATAAERFIAALQRQPGAPELVLGLVEALDAEGDAAGIELLEESLRNQPGWIEGHQQLAKMRVEAGEGDAFARSFDEALQAQPANKALHLAHWQMLAGAEQYAKGLAALRRARPHLPEDRDLMLIEARLLSETGDRAGAQALFDRLDAGPDVEAARGRHALHGGDGTEAERRFGAVVALHPSDVAGWANLALAWRLTGNARFAWLCEQPGLWRVQEIAIDGDGLARLAQRLRGLHRARAHPLGQSLRGGTQTRGRLLWRGEPEIVALRDRLRAAVEQYVELLPPKDDAHPLLRHRDTRLDFSGSWSVRLTGEGFHVNHIHTRGVLSSAFYVSLPDGIGNSSTREGWLELGRPPVEFGLNLPPLATIEPAPGRLALFPSYLFHGTRPFSNGERLTVAFDVAPAPAV
jgi:tetratricopeptide (TPR) repeat protein